LHMAQLMPLSLTVSCSSKIQIGFTFLVPAHLGNPGKRAVKRVCVIVLACCLDSGAQQLRLFSQIKSLGYFFISFIKTKDSFLYPVFFTDVVVLVLIFQCMC